MSYLRFIAVALIFVLILTPAVNDPVVDAKVMKALDDEELSSVQGEAGLTIGLNITARSTATSLVLGDGTATPDIVNVPNLYLYGSGSTSLGCNVATNLIMDFGTSAGRSYANLSGIALPKAADNYGLSLSATNINVAIDNGTVRTIGNLDISNAFLGRTVTQVGGTAITPGLANVADGWLRLGPHASGGGLEGVGQLALYIDSIFLNVGNCTGANCVKINGLYLFGATQNSNSLSTTPSAWSSVMNGNALLGGHFPTYNINGSVRTGVYVDTLANINIGTSGSNTILSINLPMAATIKARDFNLGAALDLGLIMIDNAYIYKNEMRFHNL